MRINRRDHPFKMETLVQPSVKRSNSKSLNQPLPLRLHAFSESRGNLYGLIPADSTYGENNKQPVHAIFRESPR